MPFVISFSPSPWGLRPISRLVPPHRASPLGIGSRHGRGAAVADELVADRASPWLARMLRG
jgi:hypothetical protein